MLGHAVTPQHMVGRLGVVVCLVGLNAKHAVISRRMLGHLVAVALGLWCA